MRKVYTRKNREEYLVVVAAPSMEETYPGCRAYPISFSLLPYSRRSAASFMLIIAS